MDLEISPGKVIDFKPITTPRFVHQPHHAPYCKHQGKILVDEQYRTIECDNCKAVLDPFDYFLKLAIEEKVIYNNVNTLKAERLKLAEEVKRVKSELVNVKSALNRAKKQTP